MAAVPANVLDAPCLTVDATSSVVGGPSLAGPPWARYAARIAPCTSCAPVPGVQYMRRAMINDTQAYCLRLDRGSNGQSPRTARTPDCLAWHRTRDGRVRWTCHC